MPRTSFLLCWQLPYAIFVTIQRHCHLLRTLHWCPAAGAVDSGLCGGAVPSFRERDHGSVMLVISLLKVCISEDTE